MNEGIGQDDDEETSVDYQTFRVEKDDKPTGLVIMSETRMEARRQLTIAAQRLSFSAEQVELV